jgi:hypothetical protein
MCPLSPPETFPMNRFALLAAFALTALGFAQAHAQPAPATTNFQIVDAKVEKDKLVWTETVAVPVEKIVDRGGGIKQ